VVVQGDGSAVHGCVRSDRRRRLLLAVALWLLADGLLALSPLLFFVAGSSDEVALSTRLLAAAPPVVLAWPLLTLAIVLTRRRGATGVALVAGAARVSLLGIGYAVVLFAVGYRLAATSAIEGNLAWACFWAAAAAGWLALSALALRRS
jgi:hypothetical protein